MTRAFVKLAEATAPSGAVAGHTDFASARVARLTSRYDTATTEWPGLLVSFAASLLVLVSLPILSLALTEIHPLSALLP